MLDVKFHESQLGENEVPDTLGWVTINNIEDEKSWIYNSEDKEYRILHLSSWPAFLELSKYSLVDIEAYDFTGVIYHGIVDEYNVMGEYDDGTIEILISSNSKKVHVPCVRWIIRLDPEQWGKPWSIKEFAKEFKVQTELEERSQFAYWQQDDDYVINGFGISYLIEKEKIVQAAVDELELKLKQLFDRTSKALLRKIDEDSLVTFFQFKDSASIASKQYLIYFAQFLADLGIEADTELIQQAHDTLFKVTPKDKNQSLQQIKEALDVYLAASSMKPSELNSLSADSKEIAIQQLHATISHFQGQLHLANAIISAKEAESMYLRETNLHYKRQLLLSAPEPETKVEQEEIIPGIITVGEYDGNGVKINIARLFKLLKRKLSFGK